MKIGIVIPAYNEEKRIGRTLREYTKFYDNKLNTDFDYEILIVINGTVDGTERVVKGFVKKNKRMKHINLKEPGKGNAITQGFRRMLKGDSDLIGFVDADLATSPSEFWKLIEMVKGHDGAIADRYMKESKVTPAFSFRRTVVSRTFNFIVRSLFLLPYNDTQCGAKLFRRELIEDIVNDFSITEWAYDIDLLYSCQKSGFKIKSVPTEWTEVGGSTLKLGRASASMFFAIIQLRILKSPASKSLKVLSPLIGTIHKIMKG